MASHTCLALTPGACAYGTLPGKRDFADVMRGRDLEMEDYPGLSG
jgi:hypothetical protein